jgi:hypothetical protein
VDPTDTPEDVPGPDEQRPDFSEWDDPEETLRGGPVRERLLDVIAQVREPTKVSRVAERAGCDPETAREYLRWFAEMGMVREISGRPVQYERNESYWQWRRVERIREEYSEAEIVDVLSETVDAIAEYRERFGAESPDDVSLVDRGDGTSVEEVWEALSEWQTLERRAALLDAARRAESPSSGDVGPVDA